MRKKIVIWNHEYDLPIKYDAFDGEEILPEQYEAVDSFVRNEGLIDDGKAIKEYCNKHFKNRASGDMEDIQMIVKPKALYVPRDKKNCVAVLCDFKYDEEHGLAIIYKNSLVEKIGPQDIIL